MDNNTKTFINQHLRDDVNQLALKSNSFPDVDMKLALRQIAGRQKIEKKVPLFYNTDDILYPQSLSLEQCSSQITAEYKASLCTGEKFVDLTGGFGIDTYFISKNFTEVQYIEKNAELCELAEHNFNILGVNNIQIINDAAEHFLHSISGLDWIYIDPSRRNKGKKVFLLGDCEPDIKKMEKGLVEKSANILVKLSPMLDISSIVKDLNYIQEIHVLALSNECKEILLFLNKERTEDIKVCTINFKKEGKQVFSFHLKEEENKNSAYASNIKKYLYEPNAAIMKSGAFNTISNHYEVEKLHINTHLYTSEMLLEDFPGRIFSVNNVWDNAKESLKILQKNIPKANLTVRNYPLTAEKLKSKLKLSDGGDCYLFACTLVDKEKKIIECNKLNT